MNYFDKRKEEKQRKQRRRTIMSIWTNIVEVAVEDFMWVFMAVNGYLEYSKEFIVCSQNL